MEDRKLDAAESFALISRMIENTRDRMERNAGRPFLVWGYTTVVLTLLIWALVVYFQDNRWNWLWFSLPLIGGLGMYLTRPEQTSGKVYTFVDRVISQIWLVMGSVTCFIALVSMLGVVRPPMLFISVLLMGIGSTITSLVIRFTPGIVSGIIGIILASLQLISTGNWQIYAFIAAFVVMMVIPGHILNYRSNHPKNSHDRG